jgi:hypothetical protein
MFGNGKLSPLPRLPALLVACLTIALAASRGRAAPAVTPWPVDLAVDTHPWDQAHGNLSQPGLSIVADGSGGVILVWEDAYFGLLAAQRIGSDGSPLWGPSGVYVAPANGLQWSPKAVGDGSGGVIVTWTDGRNGSCGYSFYGDCDLFAQRLGPDGAARWGMSGVPIVVAPNNQGTNPYLGIVSDDAGGAIVAWYDHRDPVFGPGIYAQRIDGAGQPQWPLNGVKVFAGYADGPRVVPDGSHGAILSWSATNQAGDDVISVQRVTSAGLLGWGPDAVAIEVGGGYFSVAADGSGGVLVGYVKGVPAGEFVRLLPYAQRVNAAGSLLWPGGRLLADAEKAVLVGPDLVADGSGGAIATWQQGSRNAPPERPELNADVYAQRIGGDGTLRWALTGLPVSNRASDEMAPRIAEDGSGGAIVAWNDCRNHPQLGCQVTEQDLFGQRLTGGGVLAWGADGVAISTAPANQGVSYGAAPGPSSVALLAVSGGVFVAWPDGRNGSCRYGDANSNCDLYAQRLPEPGNVTALSVGLAFLAALGKRRRADQIRRLRPAQYGSRSLRR